MKTTIPSPLSVLLSLGVIALIGCSQGAGDQGHAHGPDADHSHEEATEVVHHDGEEGHGSEADHSHEEVAKAEKDDRGHTHGAGADHDDHSAAGEPVLGFALTETPLAGSSFTFSLLLSDEEGHSVAADDLIVSHEHKLHVMIVDEALQDYHHLHPSVGPDGLYQVTFTPKFSRRYRVWADYRLAGDEAHSHDANPHGHDGDNHHGDDHDAAGDAITISQALIVGDNNGPEVTADSLMAATSGGFTYSLNGADQIKAGTPTRLSISVSDASGDPFQGLEPIMGAYAHLVGFNEGATQMAQAHPMGDHPHGANSRGGPDLGFDVTFEEPGAHRLFLQTKTDGGEKLSVFTVMVSK